MPGLVRPGNRGEGGGGGGTEPRGPCCQERKVARLGIAVPPFWAWASEKDGVAEV